MALSPEDVAARYVAALNARLPIPDLAALFAPRVAVYHCWDEKPIALPSAAVAGAMGRKIGLCFDRITDYHNTVGLQHVAPTAITLGITAMGTYPDGAPLWISRCVVLGLNADGLIERVDNFGDHTKSQELDRLVPHKDILNAVGAGGQRPQ